MCRLVDWAVERVRKREQHKLAAYSCMLKQNRRVLVNVNIRMYNFDDVQCTVIPSVAYGFVTGMNLQLC